MSCSSSPSSVSGRYLGMYSFSFPMFWSTPPFPDPHLPQQVVSQLQCRIDTNSHGARPVHLIMVSGFGIRVSGFGFRVSGFGSWVSGLGIRGSGFGSRISGFGFRGSGFGVQVSGFGARGSRVDPKSSRIMVISVIFFERLNLRDRFLMSEVSA